MVAMSVKIDYPSILEALNWSKSLRSMFPFYFYLKLGRIIKAPQMLDDHKNGYFATPRTNMRLSKPCKFHGSTRYHTYALHAQQDSRVRTLTPTRLRRVGVSVYTSFKMRFCSWEFFEPSFRIYTKFRNFFVIAQKFQLKNFSVRIFQRSFGNFLGKFDIFRMLA